jgi:NAD(P)H-dependent flavin oxidoreductase YrpB (nitropropane dioxygenase family)
MATKECEVSPAFKEMMVRARETDTYLEPRGRAASRIFKESFTKNALQELVESRSSSIPDLDLAQTGIGQVTGMIREVRSAAEVIAGMVGQARAILPGMIAELGRESA